MVSSLGGLMATWLFQTPTVEEGPAGDTRLFEFYKIDRGISIVLQTNGVWKQMRYLVDGDFDTYPLAFRGGYKYEVDDATKASLIAGNVGVTEDNFTQL
jgi:hypothetical protein